MVAIVYGIASALQQTVQVLGNRNTNTVIDLSLGNVITATLTGAGTWSFINVPPSGTVATAVFILTNPSTNITWSPVPKWPGGSAPTMTVTGVDILTMMTVDGGTTWHAVRSSADSK